MVASSSPPLTKLADVEQAAETISLLRWTGQPPDLLGRLAGSPLPKLLARAGVSVVLDELAQHHLQVPTTEDRQVVEHLAPTGADEAFRDSVRDWPPVRQATFTPCD